MASLIVLKRAVADDSIKLTILKSRFNRLASRINRLRLSLSLDERKELHITLKEIEEQINKYS